MKAIIDRKRYDTETAEEVADWDNGCSTTDFGYCSETLYRTKSGAYFLAGHGGAMSRWSQPVGNNGRGGGSGIMVLTPGEALDWLESHNAVDAIETHFADAIQDA